MNVIKAGDLGAEHIDSRFQFFVKRANSPMTLKYDGSISMITHTRRQTILRSGNRDYRFYHDDELEVS